MGLKKKILIISPKFPYPAYGACEQDRAAGIEFFIKQGYDVQVITKVYADSYKPEAKAAGEKLGITVIPISYKYLFTKTISQKLWRGFLRLIQPWYLDGAAFEYSEPEIRRVLRETLDSFQPDLVWFDYSYLWPLYELVRKRKIPIITRSINFEPRHFLEEDGRNIINYLKFLPKLLSEYLVSKKSDVVFAITPDEAVMYKKIGARHVEVLPLRGLPACLGEFPVAVKDHVPLNVFFSGSTYNVIHNRKALEFLLTEIIPETFKQFPGQFIFHIFGGKVPVEFEKFFGNGVVKYGYLLLEEFQTKMQTMDIAVVPSLYGAGMQQKIFEPLARGFPAIVSPRGLAGYPFQPGEHLLCATTAAEFLSGLGEMRSSHLREKLSRSAQALAQQLFSEEIIQTRIAGALAINSLL